MKILGEIIMFNFKNNITSMTYRIESELKVELHDVFYVL